MRVNGANALVAGALGVSLALALLPIRPAAAQLDPIKVEVVGGGTLFDTDGMYPGFQMTDEMRITNNTGDAGAIRLRILDLVSDDNGCNTPEARVDTTCGDGEGELAEQVLLDVQRVDAGGNVVVLAPTILEDVGEVSLGVIEPGVTIAYHLTWELPITSGNETQTDSLSFDVEIAGFSLVGAPAASGVGVGVPITPGDEPVVEVVPDVVEPDPDGPGPSVGPSPATDDFELGDPFGTEQLQVFGSTVSRLPRTGAGLFELWAVGLAGIGAGGALFGVAAVHRRSKGS
jgi:hypothetical protein